jgi:hypothetical protein
VNLFRTKARATRLDNVGTHREWKTEFDARANFRIEQNLKTP